MLTYETENKPYFSLKLSHILFINYYLHILYLFLVSCRDISIVITSLINRTTHMYSNTMCLAVLLIIECVLRHLTVFLLPLLLLDIYMSAHWSQLYVDNSVTILLISHQYKQYLVAYACLLTCLQPIRREQHGSGGDCQTNLLRASSPLEYHPIR